MPTPNLIGSSKINVIIFGLSATTFILLLGGIKPEKYVLIFGAISSVYIFILTVLFSSKPSLFFNPTTCKLLENASLPTLITPYSVLFGFGTKVAL